MLTTFRRGIRDVAYPQFTRNSPAIVPGTSEEVGVNEPRYVKGGWSLKRSGDNTASEIARIPELPVGDEWTLEWWLWKEKTAIEVGANISVFDTWYFHSINDSLYYSGTNKFFRTAEQIPLREWVHLAITSQDGTMGNARLIINGTNVLNSVLQGSDTLISLPTRIRIAGSTKMSEVRVWNHVRTPEQIQETMHQRLTEAPGLVACWPLNDRDGDVLHDVSGNGHHGTIISAEWDPDNPFWQTEGFGDGMMIEEGTTNLVPSNRLKFEGWTAYSGAQVTLTQNVEFPEIGRNDATRIRTTGGTNLLKYLTTIENSIADQAYTGSVYIKNIGSKPVRFYTQLGSAVTVNPGEWTRTIGSGIGNGRAQFQLRFQALNADDDLDFIAWGPQAEYKPFATSFTTGTRAPESLRIPTAGVLLPEQGQIDVDVILTGRYEIGHFWYWVERTGSDFIRLYTDEAGLLRVANRGRGINRDSPGISGLKNNTAVRVSFVWGYGLYKIFLNGALVFERDYAELDASGSGTLFIGQHYQGRNFLNSPFYGFRILSTPMSDDEIAAEYGKPLSVTPTTTYLLDFNRNLRQQQGTTYLPRFRGSQAVVL